MKPAAPARRTVPPQRLDGRRVLAQLVSMLTERMLKRDVTI